MNIKKIADMLGDPKPYDKGTHTMWTDDYIASQLLAMHIDENHDVASRSRDKIEKIIPHIAGTGKAPKTILDLGCGPGLYSERLAKLGHHVTGIDFSKSSIAYAQKRASQAGLNITYRCQDYLDLSDEETFDIVILIYCDFGVLSVDERNALIRKIYRALKPGGCLIFDALNEKAAGGQALGKRWEMAESGGFWKAEPYICLSESFLFEKEKATLEQHLVVDEAETYALYRFWNHYFSPTDIDRMFLAEGFSRTDRLDIALNGGSYNDDGVTFYRVTK